MYAWYYIVKAYAYSIKTRSVYDYPYNTFFTSHYVYYKYTFLSNHNIHKSSCGLCFCTSDPLIDRF